MSGAVGDLKKNYIYPILKTKKHNGGIFRLIYFAKK
jgi:hypothetical protein